MVVAAFAPGHRSGVLQCDDLIKRQHGGLFFTIHMETLFCDQCCTESLWDVFRYDGEHVLTPLDRYLEDMKRVYARMKETGARIIFATTTPTTPYDVDRRQEDIVEYNREITRWLEEEGVEINDLYSFVKPHVFEYISDDHVHLNKYGVHEVGNRVVEVIKKHL